jgi:hypothetical protein
MVTTTVVGSPTSIFLAPRTSDDRCMNPPTATGIPATRRHEAPWLRIDGLHLP